jgi:heat shock protein HtpX
MKTAARITALLLSIALWATAPGLAPYQALAQLRPMTGAPVEATPATGLPISVDNAGSAMPLDTLGASPMSTEQLTPLGNLTAESAEGTENISVPGRSSARSASSAVQFERGLHAAPARAERRNGAAAVESTRRSWTPAKPSAEASAGWSEGAAKFDGLPGLKASPVDDLSGQEGSPLTRTLAPSRSASSPVQVAGRVELPALNSAPAPTPSGSVGRTILGAALSIVRAGLGGGAVYGLHVGAAAALPSLFGYAAIPSIWAVSSAVILLPIALIARFHMSKVAEYPASRGPRWLMDGAIGGVLGAVATALLPLGLSGIQAFVKSGVLPMSHAGVVSLGPVLGMALMAVTTTVAFYLPYIEGAIRGRSFQRPERLASIRRAGRALAEKLPKFHYWLKTGLIIGALFGFTGLLGVTVFGIKSIAINLAIAGVITGLQYFFSDKLIIAVMKGQEAPESKYPELYRIVRELTQKAGMPMPKVFIVPMGVPNAFATGRDPAHAVVGVTPEAMALFNERELRGVLGHELSHVGNRDMLISAILGSMATAIAFSAYSVLWSVSHVKAGAAKLWDKAKEKIRGSAKSDRAVQDGDKPGDGKKPEVFDPLTGGVVLSQAGGWPRAFAAIWGPIVASMLQMAGTRTREFGADEDGAKLTGDPKALADALAKLMTWKPGAGFRFDPNRGPIIAAVAPMFTVDVVEQLENAGVKNLRLPQFSWSSIFWVGTGVVYGLLTGWSTPSKFVTYAFLAWQFLGAKPLFNVLWLGAMGLAVASGWHSPLTLLAFAFLSERVAVWTVALLKKMLPRNGEAKEDGSEFLFRKFVSHPKTTERINRLQQMQDAMDKGKGPTPPSGPTFGAKPDDGGPEGSGLQAAPSNGVPGRTGLDGRLLPAVLNLKGRLEASGTTDLSHLGWALNDLLKSGGSVRYADTRTGDQPALSRFDPATRSIELSESLRHAEPGLQAALLAASLQEAYDHLQLRTAGTNEQARRRMAVVNAYLESADPTSLAKGLDLNNSAETGLFESLMTNRLLALAGGSTVDKRIGHLPTVDRLLEDAKKDLKLAEKERDELKDRLRLVEESGDASSAASINEELAIIAASIKLQTFKVTSLREEADERGLRHSDYVFVKSDAIAPEKLPVYSESGGPAVEPALEPALAMMTDTIGSFPELKEHLGFAVEALDQLKSRGGRILFGATPAGQAAYFSPVDRELVVNDSYRRIPRPLLAALLVHELTHADDAFNGRSLTRETEHRAFTGMARFLAAFPPKDVASRLEANNPAAVHAFQWMYSIRRQFLRGKTTLEAMVANSYTQMFHAQFVGHQSAAGTLSEFRTRTLAPARERLDALREHEKLLLAAIDAEPERAPQLHATRESIRIMEGLLSLYERMEKQYAEEASAG